MASRSVKDHRTPALPWILFASEGAALGYLLGIVVAAHDPALFVARNEASNATRNTLLAGAVFGAICGTVLFVMALRRRPDERVGERLASLRATGWGFSFMLLLWPLPHLLSWRAWTGRDLELLVASALLIAAARCIVPRSATWLARFRAASSRGNRLERLTWLPRLVVGLFVAAYVVYMSHVSLLQHYARQTTGFDLGGYANLFWNTLHGDAFYAPIFHPRNTLYLMIHAEPIVYLFLPFYAVHQHPTTLLVLQSAVLGLAAIPLYLFARRSLKSAWSAVVVSVAYLAYPPLQLANLYDFHFLPLSPFFVFWAAYWLIQERRFLFWMAAILALACREDVAIGGTIAGLMLAVFGRPRIGAPLALLSAAWFVLAKFVLMRQYGETSFVHHYAALVAPGGTGFVGMLTTLVTNPLFSLSTVATQDKLRYLLQIVVPAGVIPLGRWRWALMLLPGAAVALLSTGVPAIVDIRYQYSSHLVPYLFLTTTVALARVEKRWREHLASVICIGLGTLITSNQYGVLNRASVRNGHGKVIFALSKEHRTALRHLEEAARTLPDSASVAATERDTPHLTRRKHLFTLKYADQADAEYFLYAYDDLDYGDARRSVAAVLSSGSHGLHAEVPGYVVLRRGADTANNARLLRFMRQH